MIYPPKPCTLKLNVCVVLCCRNSVRSLWVDEEAASWDLGLLGRHRAQRSERRGQTQSTQCVLTGSVLAAAHWYSISSETLCPQSGALTASASPSWISINYFHYLDFFFFFFCKYSVFHSCVQGGGVLKKYFRKCNKIYLHTWAVVQKWPTDRPTGWSAMMMDNAVVWIKSQQWTAGEQSAANGFQSAAAAGAKTPRSTYRCFSKFLKWSWDAATYSGSFWRESRSKQEETRWCMNIQGSSQYCRPALDLLIIWAAVVRMI